VGKSLLLEQLDIFTAVATFFLNFWIGLVGRALDIELSLVGVVYQRLSVL
jgi:hypothetical protein